MASSNPKIIVSAEDRATAALKQIESQLDRLNSSAASAGNALGTALKVVGVGTVVEGFRRIVGALDDLDEAAQSFGTTAVALAEFRRSASESGVSVEKLDVGLGKLSSKLADAATGGKDSAATFKALGINVKDASGQLKSTETILGEVANKFQGFRDGTEKTAIAIDLFGKSGARMIPFLNQGAEGLRKFAGVTDEMVKAGVKLQAQFDTLKANSQAFAFSLAQEIIPFLSKTIEEFNAAKEAAGGFAGALVLLARQSAETLNDPGKKIHALTEELEGLRAEALKPLPTTMLDALVSGAPDPLQGARIEAIQTELKLLKTLQRTRALANAPTDEGAEERRFRKRAPKLPDKPDKETKEKISDAQRALAQYVETLEKEAEKLALITEEQKALNFLRANPSVDNPQVRELLLTMARAKDAAVFEKNMNEFNLELEKKRTAEAKERARLSDEIGEAEKRQLAEQNRALRELTGQADQDRIKGLQAIVDAADLIPAHAKRAQQSIDDLKIASNEMASSLAAMGEAAANALGELVAHPEDFKSIFTSLTEQILRMTTQLLIVEPIIKSIRSSIAGSISGDGSIDFAKLFGSLVGSFDTGTDYVPKTGLALVHKGEKIIPARENRGSAGNVINVHFGGPATPATASQIGASIARELSIHNRRNN